MTILYRERPVEAAQAQSGMLAQGDGRNLERLAGRLRQVSARFDEVTRVRSSREGEAAGADGTFERRSDFAVGGAEFNAAAERSALARIDLDLARRSEEISNAHAGDPDGMAKAFSDLGAEYEGKLRQRGMGELVPGVSGRISRYGLAAEVDAADAQAKAQQDEAAAAALPVINQSLSDIQRFAASGNGDGAALEMAQLEQTLLTLGPKEAFTFRGQRFEADPRRAGYYDVQAIEKSLGTAETSAKIAALLGEFRRLPGTGAREASLARLEEAYLSGQDIAGLSMDQLDAVATDMRQQINRENVARRAREARVTAAHRDQLEAARALASETKKTINAGFPLTEDQRTGLQAAAAFSLEAAEAAALAELGEGLLKQSPAAIAANLNALYETTRDGASPLERDAIALTERYLTRARTESQQDPISYARRTGLMDVAPLTEFSAEEIETRRAEAEAVAGELGVRPNYLTQDERGALRGAVTAGDADARLSIAAVLVEGFGERAPDVLAEIADDAPVFAHAGGLLASGNSKAARDMILGQEALAAGNAPDMGPRDRPTVEADILGGAFTPETAKLRGRVMKGAKALYAGKVLSNPDIEGFDAILYEQALHESVGARFDRHGKRYGGFGEHNGRAIILPPELRADDFETLIGDLTAEDLVAGSVGGGAPRHTNGDLVQPDEIEDLHLVSIGEGLYDVFAMDPDTDEPLYVTGTGRGGRYTIDLRPLIARHSARAEL